MFFRLVQPNLVSGLSAALLTLAIVRGLSLFTLQNVYFETSIKEVKSLWGASAFLHGEQLAFLKR